MIILLDLPYRLPADTEILLFRVLQESLTNIHRHPCSGRAKIRAGIDGETVYLEIRDYGHGLPQRVLESFTTSGNGVGVGLAGIRERLREVRWEARHLLNYRGHNLASQLAGRSVRGVYVSYQSALSRVRSLILASNPLTQIIWREGWLGWRNRKCIKQDSAQS